MMWTTRPRSDFGSLRAIVEGHGTPVLLLHGVGLRAEAWSLQVRTLSETFTVIAPDMPGHGETPLADTMGQLSSYTDRVANALSTPLPVVGHSMGALIALDLAIRYPGSVSGVVALNAVFERPSDAKTAVIARATNLSDDRPADPTQTLNRWFDNQETPEAQACKNWLCAVDPRAYKQAYTVFATEDGPASESLEELKIPALFMTGSKEPNSTPAMSKAMAAIVPKGRAIIVDDAAHMMPMTHAETVNKHLQGFLKECVS